MEDNRRTNNSQRVNKNLKFSHYEESKAEKISKLLKRLDEIKKGIYSGERSDQEKLKRFAKDFGEVHADPRFSIYVEAAVLELEGRLQERKGGLEGAKSKYLEAAEKLIQWVEITSKGLIGKSILLKSTRSLEAAKEAYKKLKEYIEGQPLRIEGSVQRLIGTISPGVSPGTAKEKPHKLYENDSLMLKKIILTLIKMGKPKIALITVKYLNLERVEIYNDILGER